MDAAQLADALSRSLGVQVTAYDAAANLPDYRFTLSADEQPFWEVIMDLSRQHGLEFQSWTNFQLRPEVGWNNGVLAGPLLIVPHSVTRIRTAYLQHANGKLPVVETLGFGGTIALDPRVRVQKHSSVVFTRIVDDLGQSLYTNKDSDALWGGPPLTNGFVQDFGIELEIPDARATRIASAKGFFSYSAMLHEDYVDVPDVTSHIGQSYTVGSADIRLDNAIIKPEADSPMVRLEFTLPPSPPMPERPLRQGIGNFSNIDVTVTLFDSTGKPESLGGIASTMGRNIPSGYKPPFKLRFSYAKKSKEVTVPFELKNLPLP